MDWSLWSLAHGHLFVAEAYVLPFLPTYKNVNKSQGNMLKRVNFAYAGATAIELKYFKNRIGVQEPAKNNSLNVQFDWFKNIKSLLCKSEEGFILITSILFL